MKSYQIAPRLIHILEFALISILKTCSTETKNMILILFLMLLLFG